MSDVFPAPPIEGEVLPDDEWRRLSPRMLLVHPVVEVLRVSPGIVAIAFGGAGETRDAIVRGLVTAAIVAALGLSRWFTTRLRISQQQVQLKTGLLRRRTLSAPRATIRTVDVTAHPLHRVLGLARVVVGTGIDDRRGRGRIILDGLPRPSADTMRDELLGHRSSAGLMAPGAPVALDASREDPQTIAVLHPAWIRLAPFTLSGAVTGLIVLGFLFRAGSESGRDVLRSGPASALGRTLRAMPTAVAVIVVLLVVVAVVALLSTIGYVLLFWNFRLSWPERGTLEVRRGLLTTRVTSLERRRLVGVELAEPLSLRVAGGARLVAIATGLRVGRGAERGGEVLLPPAPRTEARRVASAVGGGSRALDIAVDGALVRHPRAAARRRLVRSVGGGLVLLAAAIVGTVTGGSIWPVVVAIVLLALTVPLGLDRYRSLGHARSGDGAMITRVGSLNRRTSVLAGSSIIGWTWRSSVFQRRAGLVTLIASTAAGKHGYAVEDLDADDAVYFASAVTPGLLDEFREPREGRRGARHRALPNRVAE